MDLFKTELFPFNFVPKQTFFHDLCCFVQGSIVPALLLLLPSSSCFSENKFELVCFVLGKQQCRPFHLSQANKLNADYAKSAAAASKSLYVTLYCQKTGAEIYC